MTKDKNELPEIEKAELDKCLSTMAPAIIAASSYLEQNKIDKLQPTGPDKDVSLKNRVITDRPTHPTNHMIREGLVNKVGPRQNITIPEDGKLELQNLIINYAIDKPIANDAKEKILHAYALKRGEKSAYALMDTANGKKIICGVEGSDTDSVLNALSKGYWTYKLSHPELGIRIKYDKNVNSLFKNGVLKPLSPLNDNEREKFEGYLIVNFMGIQNKLDRKIKADRIMLEAMLNPACPKTPENFSLVQSNYDSFVPSSINNEIR